ncbi:type VI secretion system Vgr family protein [Rhodoferax sp. U11-2br]|uniref:type VI secretion system Vgr family protein n=1 Tax=Rhodoferax sp. U11-2br TaxID=2838878 RepID=UPI001BE9D272|nr:type VI secretion system tip protein TssI/VgrG [Rhodoferax sp. U11-2br]MBT3067692.1 type VI secretion system tip protein VgrG [Rhodoferax sp. U11-2br]
MPSLMDIVSSLGKDAFVFQHLTAREELSRPSVFEVDMLSAQAGISAAKILGQRLTLKHELKGGCYRYFNGYVTRFQQMGTRGKFYAYHATVRPWLWLLTRTADCRIFQDKTVPEIVLQVFADHKVADTRLALSNSYRKHSYCVQYRESDFNFVSRLMEQEGIYYFFIHAEGRHTLVLADAYSAHAPTKGYDKLLFKGSAEPVRPDQEYVSQWGHAFEIQPGRYETDAFDFEHPSTELAVSSKMSADHVLADYEVYDYPGDHLSSADGNRLARTRMEELQTSVDVVHGESNVRGLSVGALFTLGGQPQADQNQEYLVLSTIYKLSSGDQDGGVAAGDSCVCRFTVLSSKQPFRPRRTTPRPLVQGPQTAIVVGPAGEDIHTDKYGRVKVQFHWDRYGKKNDNSSCWVRISHPMAGKAWGMVTIPRIGQEVIVDFLEGDPDQPIITGRVYNADQMPPWELPANKTQSGVLTRSTQGGSSANANAIRFEDKKGSEQLWIHAEKNQDIEVENDETHWVGHDRTHKVDHNEMITVGSNHSLTIGASQVVAVGASQTVSVGASQSVTVGANLSEVVGGAQTSTVAKGRSTSVAESDTLTVGKNLVIEAGDSVTIKTGSASIVMKKDGTIQIKGQNITIESAGKINVKASGDLVMKGSKILQN